MINRICLVLATFLAFETSGAQTPPVYKVTSKQLYDFSSKLLNSLDPGLPGNAYFTSYMKEKLSWIHSQVNKGGVEIQISTLSYTEGKDNPDLMLTTWSKRPLIIVHAARIWMLLKIQHQFAPPELYKNVFAAALIHEVVHIERGRFSGLTRNEIIAEEAYAWNKVNLEVVRPLRKAGHPLLDDFIEMDNVLKKCNDKPDCPLFLEKLIREKRAKVHSK